MNSELFRAYAKEVMGLAQRTDDIEDRQSLIELAIVWMRAHLISAKLEAAAKT